MVRVKMLGLAAATALMSTVAQAADFPPSMPPPNYHQAPIDTAGWYLRGDVGVGAQSFKQFEHVQSNANFVWPASWTIEQKDMGDAAFVGFGIGYAWNSWLRFDFTGEYRAKAKFKTVGSYTEFCPGGKCFDVYDGHHSSWVFMANGYFDFGTWYSFTPFIGAGIGAAYHRITSLTDIGLIADGSTGFGLASADASKWNFAWAVHAGVAYSVTSNFKVEFAYRYLNMGTAQTAIIDCASNGCQGNGPRAYYNLTNFESHDLKLGVRWMLQPEPTYQPPLIRKG